MGRALITRRGGGGSGNGLEAFAKAFAEGSVLMTWGDTVSSTLGGSTYRGCVGGERAGTEKTGCVLWMCPNHSHGVAFVDWESQTVSVTRIGYDGTIQGTAGGSGYGYVFNEVYDNSVTIGVNSEKWGSSNAPSVYYIYET